MRFIIFVFISLITISSTVFSAQQVTILVESGNFYPFKLNDKNGKVTGIYPEIVRNGISRMPEYSVKFKEVPWARAKNYIKNGTHFAMLPPYFHAHDWLTDKIPKRPYIWPYSLPLLTQTDAVVCDAKKLEYPRPNWPEDYQDLHFVMLLGDGKAGYKFNKMVKEKKIKAYFVTNTQEMLKLLLQGRHDCTVISVLAYKQFIKEMKKKGEYAKLVDLVILDRKVIRSNEGYLGYTDINAENNFPFKKDFTIKFDIEIYKMKKNGEIKEIIEQFIDSE